MRRITTVWIVLAIIGISLLLISFLFNLEILRNISTIILSISVGVSIGDCLKPKENIGMIISCFKCGSESKLKKAYRNKNDTEGYFCIKCFDEMVDVKE